MEKCRNIKTTCLCNICSYSCLGEICEIQSKEDMTDGNTLTCYCNGFIYGGDIKYVNSRDDQD